MKNKKFIYGILFSFLLMFIGCDKDLDIANVNNPDSEQTLAKPEDLTGLAGGIMKNFITSTHEYYGMALALWVASDQGTCSWGNGAMRDASTEPRTSWDNSTGYAYANTNREFYLGLNNVLSLSNRLLNQIVNVGTQIDDNGGTEMVEAFSRLGQGISLGYLGLVYDKAMIVDESMDLSTAVLEPSDYATVLSAALGYLDQCIAICNSTSFEVPVSYIQGDNYDNVKLAKLANSFAARILVYGARNASETNSINWSAVKAYASNGMDSDFFMDGDEEAWMSLYQQYANAGGWGRVDMRIVHLLDPNQPDYFPLSGEQSDLPNAGVASSADARLASDFEYLGSQSFRPERGFYHFSSYRYSRIDEYVDTEQGIFYDMRVTENEMFLAEAELRLGNLSAAADIINASTYVTRGGLRPVSANATEIEDAIFYEREIELFTTGVGISYFDMRRRDLLQAGTPLHFPIPSQQLQVMQMAPYSFGGVANADGINVSNGGWR